MCAGPIAPSAPSIPAPPPPPPLTPAVKKATPSQPKLASEGVKKAQTDTENKARQFAGTRGGTLITGAGGLQTQANTAKKTLLG